MPNPSNPFTKFYKGTVVKIEGKFACNRSHISDGALYEIKTQTTYWICEVCGEETKVEGVEMNYE